MKQPRSTERYSYPMARRIGYESLGLRRQTEIEFDPRKAALYTLIASVAVSAGATAYANISHEPIPFPHPTLDTRHEDVFDTHAPASTVTEQADGSQLYTPAHPDTAKEDRLLLSKVQLQEAAVSAGYGLEVAQDDAKLTQTMNAALQVLREDDFDQTDLTITNVIKHANVIALSDEQAAELKQAASHRKESVSQLIADYKNGKLGTDQTDATTVESLLADNSNDSYTVRFDKDGRDFNATLYKIDDAYTLVAERPQTEKPAGGQYPIVIIPIPIPWFRRREYYEFNDRTYWTTVDGDLVKHSYAKESRPVGGAVRVNDAVQTTIIDQGISAVDSRYATDRLYGPRLENGGFYGWQRGGSRQPVAEPEADPEPPVEDDKLATIIPFPLRPQAEIVAEPEVIEDASAPEVAPVPEYEPIPELEDAAEDEEKEPKRRLRYRCG